ncbi:hypothetical protein HRED_03050 [Candidatus Haloredivivus sp. G17]|nr:hypothetical protein HRED_03050 [Candidatus Haloredivivus sp. G17]
MLNIGLTVAVLPASVAGFVASVAVSPAFDLLVLLEYPVEL